MRYEVIIALEKVVNPFIDEKKGAVTEEELRTYIEAAKAVVEIAYGTITDEEINEAIKNTETRFSITMDKGIRLVEDDYKKWYFNSKYEREANYWDAYCRHLTDNILLPKAVVNEIDRSTEDIMDLLGDPLGINDFQRKGLVIGAVQSGKTSNYTALINKAADSGYKVIILLTGTIEKLRKQTQGRIDEGFVGKDSKKTRESIMGSAIGVGKYREKGDVISLTTTDQDFQLGRETIGFLSAPDPVIFVVKKNKAILDRLYRWLTVHLDASTTQIDRSLLMIDDEADNASINTKNSDVEATAINNGIRNMLKLFTRYSYVGYTATPFANVFIDPQIDKSMKDDLFPRDFIYLLQQPSNYVGPTEMYRDNGRYNYMLRYNDDVESKLPMSHKKNDTVPTTLPKTLTEAISLFFIANAIRDVRGDKNKHRSMLIHITRYISVQNILSQKIDDYVRDKVNDIKHYSLAEGGSAYMSELHDLFDKEYKVKNNKLGLVPISEPWDVVKKSLYKAVSSIQVAAVNSGTAAQHLSYEDHPNGLRIIAVGGLSIARGLTLEGLIISYFYRNTKMYDTLMQMGRWFGYRDGYVDLCRLWISKESAGWYAHIAEATEELRLEVKRMAAQNKTPKGFGLRVRSSKDTPLIITAKNKMAGTETKTYTKHLNGTVVETAIVPSNIEEIRANNNVIEKWLIEHKAQLQSESEMEKLGKKGKPIYKNIAKKDIIELLTLLEFPYLTDFSKDSTLLKELATRESSIFDNWDVAIATNKKRNKIGGRKFADIDINPVNRSFDLFGINQYIRFSGPKKRLGSTDYALSGLKQKEYKDIKKAVDDLLETNIKTGKKKAPTEGSYFTTEISRNPLLVIYPVKLKRAIGKNKMTEDTNLIVKKIEEEDLLVTGISMGIPSIAGVESITYEFVINKKIQMELIHGNSNFNDEPEEDDNDLMNEEVGL